jgi:hypothetical protein
MLSKHVAICNSHKGLETEDGQITPIAAELLTIGSSGTDGEVA